MTKVDEDQGESLLRSSSAAGERIGFSVSIDLAVSRGPAIDETIRRSGVALYDARLAGRNRVMVAA